MTGADRIKLAHEIAVKLWDAGQRGPDGLAVMGMALGIYMEAQEGAHREFKPLADVMCRVAQEVFDRFQRAKKMEPGNG
jgi:hypothetical protein